jgi:hypothetical protein
MISVDNLAVRKFQGLLADNVNAAAMFANGAPLIPQYVTVSESVPVAGTITVASVPVKAGRRVNIILSVITSRLSSSLGFFQSVNFLVGGTVVATRQARRPDDFQTIALQLTSPPLATTITFTGIDWFYNPDSSTGHHDGFLAGTTSFAMPTSLYNWQIYKGVECPTGSFSVYKGGSFLTSGTTTKNSNSNTGTKSMPWTLMQPYMPTADSVVDISVSGLYVSDRATLRVRQ